MRIAFLHRDLPPDTYTGVAVQVHRLANALVGLGHQVDIFTWTPQPTLAKYRVIPMGRSGVSSLGRHLPLLKRLWHAWQYRKLNLGSYDAVHVHGDGGLLRYQRHWVRTLYGTAAFERRYGSGWKSWVAQTLSLALERREARHCRHLVAIGEHVRTAIPQVTEIIPCMLDAAPTSEPAQAAEAPTLIHVGALHGRKRGRLALFVVGQLQTWREDFRLHLVCPPQDAELLSRTLIDPRIQVHTQLSHEALNALYRESWFALSLSTYEGFGVAMIEALAQGCRVLSAPHEGARDLFADERPDILCDTAEMPDRIRALIAAGKPDAVSVAGAKLFATRFSPQTIALAYVELYRKAAEGRQK